jgi:hypothetical protein
MIFRRPSRPARWARTGSQLAVTALAMAMVAGCGGSGGTAGVPAQQVAQNGPKPSASPVPSWQLKALARKYLAVAKPANRRLDTANDSFEDSEHGNLPAARGDLRSEAATERWFDHHLAKIAFPPAIEAMVRALIEANSYRIKLTSLQAKSDSLAELRSFDTAHQGTDEAVENEVKLVRQALRLPPPADS